MPMKLVVQTAWLKAAIKEARKRAKVVVLQTDGYELSKEGRKTRELALEVILRLEGL